MKDVIIYRPMIKGDPKELNRLSGSVNKKKSKSNKSNIKDFEYILDEMQEMTSVAGADRPNYFLGVPVGMTVSIKIDEKLPIKEMSAMHSEYSLPELHDPKGDVFYMSDLIVHPNYRGKGIEKELFDRNIELAKSMNADEINFIASEKNNGLYKKLGAKPVDKTYTKYHGEPSRWWKYEIKD